jgi:uncharacterized protein
MDLPVSPCIRMCCLDPETDVCTGCFRSLTEITGWHGADASERCRILGNCAQRRAEYAARYPGYPGERA